jgi:hypothetical protein
MLPAKLTISYKNIFTFFDKFKETFKFWASSCQVKGLSSSPLCTQDTVTKSCVRQVRTGGVVIWQVLFFLPRVAGFPQPRSHMTWIFGFLVLFAEKVKKASLSLRKKKEKTLLEEYDFSRILSLQRFFSCKHSKKSGHI